MRQGAERLSHHLQDILDYIAQVALAMARDCKEPGGCSERLGVRHAALPNRICSLLYDVPNTINPSLVLGFHQDRT
jgi:hypothetical protein